jgi:hypothetical protein
MVRRVHFATPSFVVNVIGGVGRSLANPLTPTLSWRGLGRAAYARPEYFSDLPPVFILRGWHTPRSGGTIHRKLQTDDAGKAAWLGRSFRRSHPRSPW